MSDNTNKALVFATIDEGWNTQRLPIFDELFAAHLVDHSVPPGLPQTREGTKPVATLYWSAFPDLPLTIEDQIAEGDKVGRQDRGDLGRDRPVRDAPGARGHPSAGAEGLGRPGRAYAAAAT